MRNADSTDALGSRVRVLVAELAMLALGGCYERSNAWDQSETVTTRVDAMGSSTYVVTVAMASDPLELLSAYTALSVGEGEVTIFRDGRAMAGYWRRPTRDAMITFFDAQGRPILLKPGQTWIQIIPAGMPFTN